MFVSIFKEIRVLYFTVWQNIQVMPVLIMDSKMNKTCTCSSRFFSKDCHFIALPGNFCMNKKYIVDPIFRSNVDGSNKLIVKDGCGCWNRKRKRVIEFVNQSSENDLASFSKNDYFDEHKYLMLSIAKSSVRAIHKKFIFLNPDDLLSYAYEGMVLALSKVTDIHRAKTGYLYIHACKSCLHGALSMSGIRRRQKKFNILQDGQIVPIFKSIQPFKPEQMIEFQDTLYLESCLPCESENKIVDRLDARIFYYQLKNKKLKQIFLLLMHGKCSQYICKKLNISKRSYYYHLKKLNQFAALFSSERSGISLSKELPAIDMRKVFECCEDYLWRKLNASSASYKTPRQMIRVSDIALNVVHRCFRPKRLLKDRKRF